MTNSPFRSHLLQLYQDDAFLAETVCRFVAAAMGESAGAVVIATPLHWALVRARLEERGFDVASVLDRGQLVALDTSDTLEQILVHGTPDRAAFDRVVPRVIAGARRASRFPRVHVFGEMVNVLWERGDWAASEQLEMLWNEYARREEFRLLCAYRMTPFDDRLPGIAAAHTSTLPGQYDDVHRAAWDASTENTQLIPPSSTFHDASSRRPSSS